MEVVRLEREALVQAELKAIQEATLSKQALLEAIRQAESERLKATAEIAVAIKRPLRDLTLNQVIISVQGLEPKTADQLRSSLNMLTILVERIQEQNEENRSLLEKSLEHLHTMKRNVLGEATPKANTYTSHGQKSHSGAAARWVSREA
jgi:flagellar biosynthesis/type III secretory pathway chaperone